MLLEFFLFGRVDMFAVSTHAAKRTKLYVIIVGSPGPIYLYSILTIFWAVDPACLRLHRGPSVTRCWMFGLCFEGPITRIA